MKKVLKNKFTLEKFQVAKLNNLKKITGGHGGKDGGNDTSDLGLTFDVPKDLPDTYVG